MNVHTNIRYRCIRIKYCATTVLEHSDTLTYLVEQVVCGFGYFLNEGSETAVTNTGSSSYVESIWSLSWSCMRARGIKVITLHIFLRDRSLWLAADKCVLLRKGCEKVLPRFSTYKASKTSQVMKIFLTVFEMYTADLVTSLYTVFPKSSATLLIQWIRHHYCHPIMYRSGRRILKSIVPLQLLGMKLLLDSGPSFSSMLCLALIIFSKTFVDVSHLRSAGRYALTSNVVYERWNLIWPYRYCLLPYLYQASHIPPL